MNQNSLDAPSPLRAPLRRSRPAHGPPVWTRLAVVLASIALLAGCSKARREQSSPPELPSAQVRTQTIKTESLPAFEEVVGTVRAKVRATLEAKVTGRILELPLTLGQKISAGQLVARLDAPEIKARLEQAEANLEQAERDWKRVGSLYDQQAATRADYDAAHARLQVGTASVAEARALLDYVEVKAPFEGVVTRKWAEVGDLAVPGKPLVDVEDPGQLQIEADVPEAIMGQVQAGARMAVRRGDGRTELSATVAEIAPSADTASRTFRVKLDLPDSPELRLGEFARLAVPVGESTSIRVPAAAVIQRGEMEIVFAIEDGRARLHLVKTGRQFNDEVEILSGLDSGDTVVVEHAAQLLDGQPVSAK